MRLLQNAGPNLKKKNIRAAKLYYNLQQYQAAGFHLLIF